jgi:hypothetical protein
MPEFFVKEAELLGAISQTAANLLENITEDRVIQTIRAKATYDIARDLMNRAKIAMEGHTEYDYEPLKEHLMQNLEYVRHVRISYDLSTVDVFDEEVGGTAEDFEAGRYHGSRNDPKTRSLMWKYGIFMPAREGGAGFQWTKESEPQVIADYDTIIQARLEEWGDKAPYWYFLEHGNADFAGGYPSPYPVFGPTNFIFNTAEEAPHILEKIIEEEIEDISDGIEEVLDEADQTYRGPTISVIADDVDGGWRAFTFRSSLGKIYTQYKEPDTGRWRSYEYMLAHE